MTKKRNVDGNILNENEDRISELPRNLLESILERISLNEAARTSILSTKWRYIWTNLPSLVLDKKFFLGIIRTSNKKNDASQFLRIIDKILTVYNGPIQKFVLYIPFNQTPDMDLWILTLSKNGIKELTLDNNYNPPYKLPSYFFSCDQLTYLKLDNCVLNPPLAFSGFSNLNKLYLERISLSTNTGSLISTLPALHDLCLGYCAGVENLKNLPPKLNWFVSVNSHEFRWQCFQSKTGLSVLSIVLGKRVKNVDEQVKQFNKNVDEQVKQFKLMNLLANLPRLDTLWLDGFSLKFLAAGIFTKCHPSYNLNEIRLFSLWFNDLDQVSCALCLLRSSPNLQKLEIEASSVTKDYMEQQDLDNMEATANLDMELNQLRSVKLRFFKGLKAELLFVKLLLSHSPLLQRIIIDWTSDKLSANKKSRISKQLERFRRASTVTEIIYEKPKF